MTRKLALLGAEARIRQLQEEAEEIYRLYPELRQATRSTVAPSISTKRRFSAQGKKAISEGMRKYWARRRAKSGKAERSSA